MADNGVYWIGQDNNVWAKDNSGTVKNQGQLLKAYDQGFDTNQLSAQGYNRIADPNPGNPSTVIQAGATYTAPKPVYAPKLDIAGINSQARSAAENAVNPYYTKALNDYLEKEAFQRSIQEAQTKTNVKNLEDTFNQTLDQNATTQRRTGEDVGTNLAQVARAEDQFQTDSGQAFDAARIAEARRASIAGTTGGTAAAGQESLQTKNATTEQRQEQQYQDQRDQQELFKNRTFEDIAKSNATATTSKEKGVSQANFDLDNFIKSQALDEKSARNDLEKSRLESIQSNQKSQASLLFSNWLAGITDPAKYLAAAQTYGGQF
jgi:hypothetical protein